MDFAGKTSVQTKQTLSQQVWIVLLVIGLLRVNLLCVNYQKEEQIFLPLPLVTLLTPFDRWCSVIMSAHTRLKLARWFVEFSLTFTFEPLSVSAPRKNPDAGSWDAAHFLWQNWISIESDLHKPKIQTNLPKSSELHQVRLNNHSLHFWIAFLRMSSGVSSTSSISGSSENLLSYPTGVISNVLSLPKVLRGTTFITLLAPSGSKSWEFTWLLFLVRILR